MGTSSRVLERTGVWMAAFAATCVCLLFLAVGSADAAPSFGVHLTRPEANEIQQVAVNATGGKFVLEFGGGGAGVSETAEISATATAAEVQSALDAITSISAEGGAVSVTGGPGNAGATSPYVVTFEWGPLAEADVPQLVAVSAPGAPLSGGAATVSVSTAWSGGAPVHRGDERVNYAINLRNTTAPAAVVTGEHLACNHESWGGSSPTFAYQWLRNGAPIAGQTSSTYTTVAPADEGKLIQCQVTATNTVENAIEPPDYAGSTDVAAGFVVNPQPVTAPPTAPSAGIEAPAQSGSLAGTATRELTCKAGAWGGAPTEYTYQWYRDGVAKGSPVGPTAATESKLTLLAAEQKPPAVFQCAVTATNTGGARTAVSANRATATAPNPVAPASNHTLYVSTPDYVNTPITVEFEAPGGQETFLAPELVTNSSWSCSTQLATAATPAKATCTNSLGLAPGASYPSLEIAAALGADAPELALAKATVSATGVTTVSKADEFDFAEALPFEITGFDSAVLDPLGNNFTAAGAHPYAALAAFALSTHRVNEKLTYISGLTLKGFTPDFLHGLLPFKGFMPTGAVKVVTVDAARGFVGNALVTPELCPSVEAVQLNACPADSAVGGIELRFDGFALGVPIYSIEPEYGEPAEFAFTSGSGAGNVLVTFVPKLRANEGYAISFVSAPIPKSPALLSSTPVLCSFGAKLQVGTGYFERCKTDEPAENPFLHPLITNPTRCTGTLSAGVQLDSWENPQEFKTAEYTLPQATECEKVHFEPTATLVPTNRQADSPTGLNVEIAMPTEGLESDSGVSQANLDTAKVTFPQGMSINPATANGLEACSEAQVGLGNNNEATCPESSKVGTIEIETPILRGSLTGGIYVAKQDENPFKSTLGLYMVFSSKKNGIIIKIAGKLVPDPVTGQLTAVFTENPEDPFSKLVLHFNEGPRAPLVNPPTCGTYAIHSEFSPWSAANPAEPTPAETVSEDSSFTVNEGPGGAPCPSEALEPKLKAGLENPAAGAKTPFVLDLSRADGTQRFTGLDLTLPKGLFAYLKGVPYCPDSVLASIPSAEGTGRAQLANPSCPAASQVGTVEVGAGSGPDPFYAHGMAYWAGPYKGAPFSIAIVMPAVAGPFDLGNVVVRSGLYVDPQTAQVTVKSDPIPTILDGILLDVRDIKVNVNKPNYIVAPTSCEAMAVAAQVSGEQGSSASAFSRFQVGGCANLAFKPVFKASTSSKTSRANGASLTVKLSQAPGEANIHRVKVELPKALPSRLTTLQKACTEQVFAENPANCPAASAVGMAIAHTPILPVPLVGPAYFVSHGSAKFPELILVLQGDGVTIYLDGETFISKTGVTSSTFASVPDAPVESFELNLPTGKDSALAANGNLCTQKLVMPTEFTGQNGAVTRQDTKIAVTGCAKAKTLTRAQKLSKALKACKQDKNKTKRAKCEKTARKKYGPLKKKSKGKSKKPKK